MKRSLLVMLVFLAGQCVNHSVADTNDVVLDIRSFVVSAADTLPQGRRRMADYLREFGLKSFYWKNNEFSRMAIAISNNYNVAMVNFEACATDEVQRLVFLTHGWQFGDAYYLKTLSNTVEMALSGRITGPELNWFTDGSRNERRMNLPALYYDVPGVSNLVLRLIEFHGRTNGYERILSGEARTSVSNYLEEVSSQ